MRNETAEALWTRLSGTKSATMTKVERYAALTIPHMLKPNGTDRNEEMSHDYQSIGAQAVNHMTNKVMMTMFRPSAPFFRVQTGKETDAELRQAGIAPGVVATALAEMERNAARRLDAMAQRPALYQGIRHLIIAGNVLMTLGDDNIRMQSLRYFCVQRNIEKKVQTLVVREEVPFSELTEDVKKAIPTRRYTEDTKVCHYKVVTRTPDGGYILRQWVDEQMLPKEFNGRWTERDCPYRVLTWNLADEADYGTGLVEEYSGDLEALSALSEALVDGAVLAAELRWMVNPAGVTSADDLNNSKNGDALAGTPQDVAPVQAGNPQVVIATRDVIAGYEQRVARGFLMLTAVTRQAERVTAEEIRLHAQELETGHGGVYSSLSAQMQEPVAYWLLKRAGTSIEGTDYSIEVITGLDALSRNGDLEAFRLAMGDMAALVNLPPALQARLKFDDIMMFVGQGRGIDLKFALMTDDEFAKSQQQNQQTMAGNAAAVAAGTAAGEMT